MFYFYKNYSRIYELLLNKDMEQIEFTSDFVTKLIQTEIENLLSGLEASQKFSWTIMQEKKMRL